jgi:hypothetical protein
MMDSEKETDMHEARPPGKRPLGRTVRETMLTLVLAGYGSILFLHYRGKAHGSQALDTYITLRGYAVSYLGAYQFMLILFWSLVALAGIAWFLKWREDREIADFKRRLEEKRKVKGR